MQPVRPRRGVVGGGGLDDRWSGHRHRHLAGAGGDQRLEDGPGVVPQQQDRVGRVGAAQGAGQQPEHPFGLHRAARPMCEQAVLLGEPGPSLRVGPGVDPPDRGELSGRLAGVERRLERASRGVAFDVGLTLHHPPRAPVARASTSSGGASSHSAAARVARAPPTARWAAAPLPSSAAAAIPASSRGRALVVETDSQRRIPAASAIA